MVSPGTCQKAATLAGLSAAVAAADCMALHCCLSLAAAPACSSLGSQCSLFSRAATAAGSSCCWDLSSYMRPGRQQDSMQGNWSHSGRRVRLESAQALSVRGLSRGRVLSLQVVACWLLLPRHLAAADANVKCGSHSLFVSAQPSAQGLLLVRLHKQFQLPLLPLVCDGGFLILYDPKPLHAALQASPSACVPCPCT